MSSKMSDLHHSEVILKFLLVRVPHRRILGAPRMKKYSLSREYSRDSSHRRLQAGNDFPQETRHPRKLPRLENLELDTDIQEVLQLASDEELEQIYGALYGNSFLSPLGKSLQTAEPALLHYQGRDVLAGHIERRFRFLAADAPSTLRGRWPSYRETLLSIREKLDVPCPSRLSTNDLESEIFLFLLLEHSDAVGAQSIHDSPSIASAAAVAKHAEDGDGMAQAPAVRQTPNLVQRIFAPLRLGAEEVLPPLTKLGATVALTNLQASVARRLGTVLTSRSVQYEITLRMAMSSGARGVAAGAQGRMAMQAAHKGLTAAATRYAAVRSLLGFIGPVMWASTLLDLAKMSIGTDYARVVKAVFMLAQIRLLRMRGWDLPSGEHTRHDEKQL